MVPATTAEAEGLLDRLLNANFHVIDDPRSAGFEVTDPMPWAR